MPPATARMAAPAAAPTGPATAPMLMPVNAPAAAPAPVHDDGTLLWVLEDLESELLHCRARILQVVRSLKKTISHSIGLICDALSLYARTIADVFESVQAYGWAGARARRGRRNYCCAKLCTSKRWLAQRQRQRLAI